MPSLDFLTSSFSLPRTLVVLIGVLALAVLDMMARFKHQKSRYALGAVLGTVLALGLVRATGTILSPEFSSQGEALAFGVFCVFVGWRMLFGSWDTQMKATVLGTFIFWILFQMISNESPTDRFAHLMAIATAAIPATIWCLLFLPYHRERLSVVLTMFFAGMLSTIPVLFYDILARRGLELHFFFFRIVPESFTSSTHMFVTGHWPGISSLQTSLLTMFISFLFVGFIEEGSKLWVLRRAGRKHMKSIDDAMQMAILVAIGFAFAENITNSGYFLSFVREYLIHPPQPDWVSFLANVAGRSILTTMVHIVSTGIMGYCLGLALLAGNDEPAGVRYKVFEWCHDILGMEKGELVARARLFTGFVLAVFLHALSDFLVSLPDSLPGNPRTIGDLLHSPVGSPLGYIALLLIPTLLYVVGGFFLLTWLFQRKQNMRELA